MHGYGLFLVTRNKSRRVSLSQTYVGLRAVSSTHSVQVSSGWTLPQFFAWWLLCSVFLEIVGFKISPGFCSNPLTHPQPRRLLSCFSLAPEPSSLAPPSWSPAHLEKRRRSSLPRLFPLLSFSDPNHRQLPNALERAFLQKCLILISQMGGKNCNQLKR